MRQRHRHVGLSEAGQALESGHPIAESANNVRVVRQCRRGGPREKAGFQNPDFHKAIRIVNASRRTAQFAIDQRKGDDHGRQAQAEIPDHREREPRCPTEAPHGVADVPDDALHLGSRGNVPNTLLDLFGSPQLDEGRTARGLRGHARSDLRFGVLLDERAELLTELVVFRGTPHPPAQHGPQARPRALHAPSRTLATAVVIDFQCCFSFASCFCPALVIS